MVYDKINNMGIYTGLSKNIRLALEWISDVNPDIEKGIYELSPRVKAIVSEYTTKVENEYGYEAHVENIDIHYLLKGNEKISSVPVEKLEIIKPYNKDSDAAFYFSKDQPMDAIIGNGYFAIYYPQDGHMPQLSVDIPENVKKIVIKIQL